MAVVGIVEQNMKVNEGAGDKSTEELLRETTIKAPDCPLREGGAVSEVGASTKIDNGGA